MEEDTIERTTTTWTSKGNQLCIDVRVEIFNKETKAWLQVYRSISPNLYKWKGNIPTRESNEQPLT